MQPGDTGIWGEQMKIVTFDTETTGIDTENDRIITCFMRARDGDEIVFEQNWVIDPDVEIPKEASDVHAMTTEWVREHGRKDVGQAIFEIWNVLEDHGDNDFVVAGYNSSFDLAILEAEVRRHGLADYLFKYEGARFIDPVIFSRKLDKYKKGGHQLITVAKRNGLKIEEGRLHAADYDVEVTEKLVKVFLNRAWRELASLREGLTPDEFVTKLQGWQAAEKKEWAEHLTEYFASQGKREDDGSKIVVSGAFPW